MALQKSYAAKLDFTPVDRYDSFHQVKSLIIETGPDEDNLTPVNLNGSTICWEVRKSSNSSEVFTITARVDNVTDGAAGKLTVDPIDELNYPPFTYQHDLYITLATGKRLHYIRGILPILSVITRPC
jgi:hypothetical protein